MTLSKVVFSNKADEWLTPDSIFSKLKREFNIILDAATDEDNPLGTKYYYTKKENGLTNDWKTWTFCNPPYSLNAEFVRKAYYELLDRGTKSILLLPSRTENSWFHRYIWDRFTHRPKENIQVRFLKGRQTFTPSKFNSYSFYESKKEGKIDMRDSAPFGSMLVIFGINR